jgi:hypothetical protein
MLKKKDRVFLKYTKSSSSSYMIIEEINKTHAIVKIINKENEHTIYKKFPLDVLTIERKKYQETIKKGDLVYCIINKVYKEKAIVLDVKDSFLKIMFSESLKQKKISRNNIIVIQ